MLVVANLTALDVRDGDAIRTRPATLSTFHIDDAGRLSPAQVYDIETNGLTQWWSGFMTL